MACNECDNDPCTEPCGCPQQVKGKCVFYQGSNLTCLDVTKGDDYDTILGNLNTLICDLVAPTGIQTTLTGCSSITVTQTTATNYNVCLSSSTQTQINNNTTNISTLSDCVEDGVNNIVSDTLDITDEALSTCGRTLRIEIPTPSGTPDYDGIIYNNADKSTYANTPGNKVLKNVLLTSPTVNYDLSTLVAGDELRVRTTGQIHPDGINVDRVTIEVWDDVSTLLYTGSFGGFDKYNKQSWKMDFVMTLLDEATGDTLVTGDFIANGVANASKSNPTGNSQVYINADVTLVYASLRIKVIYEHNSTTSATTNFARQLMVEVRKKI